MRSTTLRRWPGDPWLGWDRVEADGLKEEISAVRAPHSDSCWKETDGSEPSGGMFCRLVWAEAGTVVVSGLIVWHVPRGADGDSVPCWERTISRSVSVGVGAVGTVDDGGPAGAYGVVQEEDGASTAGRSTTSRATMPPAGVRRTGELECCNRRLPIRTGRDFAESRGNRP